MEVVPLHRARLDFLRLFKDIKITSPSTGVMLVVWPVGAVSAFPHRGTAFCRAPHTTCTHKYLYYLCVRTLYIYIYIYTIGMYILLRLLFYRTVFCIQGFNNQVSLPENYVFPTIKNRIRARPPHR